MKRFKKLLCLHKYEFNSRYNIFGTDYFTIKCLKCCKTKVLDVKKANKLIVKMEVKDE